MLKHLKYLKYVLRHKWFVLVECWKLHIFWRGLVHDLSKFRPSEWFPYVEYFYGPKTKSVHTSMAFNKAWLLHQHRNLHHWQYWLLKEDVGSTKLIPMPVKYVKEMLADWRGAGMAQGHSSIKDWYARNHKTIKLHKLALQCLHTEMKPDEIPQKERGKFNSPLPW